MGWCNLSAAPAADQSPTRVSVSLARHGREPMGKLYPKAPSRDVPRKKPGSRDRDGYKSLGLWSPKQTVGKYDALVQLSGRRKPSY